MPQHIALTLGRPGGSRPPGPASSAAQAKLDLAPPALQIVLGWYGCQMRHLTKYTKLLNAAGYPTITGICPPLAVFSPTRAACRRFAGGLLDFVETASSDEGSGSLPQQLAFYAFSNGGAYPVEQVDFLVHNDKRYQPLGPRIRGVVFDSAPCYMHWSTGARAVGEGQPLLVALLARLVFYLITCVTTVLAPGRPEAFW